MATRTVAGLVIPFLIAAVLLLFIYPDQTDQHFAWTIQPGLTALFIGCGYLTGAVFLTRAVLAERWHTVGNGFFPIFVFVWLLSIATLLHFDRFHHQSVIFFVWIGVYLAASVAIPLVWLRNRHEDPQAPDRLVNPISKPVRLAAGIVGGVMVLVGALFYLNPAWMIAIWPWSLTPLTARVLIGFFMISALTELAMARDSRWSAARYLTQGQLVGLGLVLIASIWRWGDFRSPTGRLVFIGVMLVLLLLIASLYIWQETRVKIFQAGDAKSQEEMPPDHTP